MVDLDFTNFKPEQGKLLLSEPFMSDPNFKRSVIFLANHNDDGSVGFVLNRKMELKLGQILEGFDEQDWTIWEGGPVQRDSLFFIHTLGEEVPESIQITENMYWGGNFETVKSLIRNGKITEDELKLFIGYSGWGSGQLLAEIKNNSWMVAPAAQATIMSNGNVNESDIWREAVKSLGKKFTPLANFPEDPSLN